jgi:hypothetical protein
LHLQHLQVPLSPALPCHTLPRRKNNTFDKMAVVFTTTGDLIRVHSYSDHCSASWDGCLANCRLESERQDGTGVAISPEEWAWLNSIRSLASEWMTAAEADDRSWMTRVAARIQRFSDRSDGLIDLVVLWPQERRRWSE